MMTNTITEHNMDREEIISEVFSTLHHRVPAAQHALLEAFAKRYYAACSLEDLAEHSIEALAGIVLSHWYFIWQRQPGEAKVRLFNPTMATDGWQSTHTIVQVSHDDIPFLVDSIRMLLNRNDLQIHYAIHFGGLKVKRNAQFQICELLPVDTRAPDELSEAPIHIEIDRQTDSAFMETLRLEIEHVLADVRAAVADWPRMMARVEASLNELALYPPSSVELAEVNESKDFLRWLIANHFTFLGCRDYQFTERDNHRVLQVVPGSGLGVLREEINSNGSSWYAGLPPLARRLAGSENILIITKTGTRSTIHRATYTDYIGLKRFNEAGELIGERRFIGLYTSTAYHSSPRYIPFLRLKVEKVIKAFRFPADSHNGKEIVHVLETLPRDDVFQASHDELVKLTEGILHLQEKKRIRLFLRKDAYDRFYSCLVYVPVEICDTELSLAMEDILVQALHGVDSSFTTYLSDSVLARIHFVIRVNPEEPVTFNIERLEQQLRSVASSWSDELKIQLLNEFGEADGLRYFAKYRKAFPASYTEHYLPRAAIDDLKKIESLSSQNPLEMLFYKSGTGTTGLRLKLFHTEHTIALSDVLPTLENMGLRVLGERPHQVIFRDGSIAWISDFDMAHASHREIDVNAVRDSFQDAFTHIWFRHAEDDAFNQLVFTASLSWCEVAVLRAYTRYLRQTGFTFSHEYVARTLVNQPEVTRALIALFQVRFSPEYEGQLVRPPIEPLLNKIQHALDGITSLDEDRIIRRLLEVIQATIRTNFFQKTSNGDHKSWISFKFNPAKISDLPLPRPMYEIFVYSPRVEGVHLRGGKVARGGLRWSDRREDFRTEVLGLMKAQQVKNSVIVPVGAKGGFFPKQLPVEGDRDAIMQEAIYCYTTFIRGLLDITDNICDGEVVPPLHVVRYDDDDPYLVVAADKGTATFSDIANSISKEYNFWLKDAFASGGSAGYDHKKMGITARGAWESVKRHFRELGLNPMTTDFTVVGIGDMAGDVFGNGMLQSPHIRLVAAYNHMHIFIDPNPDATASFAERKRLFELPRSAWSDYKAELISPGGGVFSRSAKSIAITAEMKKTFGITADTLVPNELIRTLLKAPVDLIWNGGIGTFVKASFETHAEVGDRNNDGLRVNGNELTARVVCEGGNLGLTQLGRVEYSLTGGVIYTDFIDNSAGVDCSDHEVNLKILFNMLIDAGQMTLEERNILLEKMTDEIAQSVLRDNYEQTQMLSLEASVASQTMDLLRRYMAEMEKRGRIDRVLEFLPSEKVLQERKINGQGLMRPEIAVMLSYSKMFLKQDILASSLPEDPWFTHHLSLAFPESLRQTYLPQMKNHSLRREIIATQLGKHVTDHMGINFVERLHRETGASVEAVLRAFVTVESIYQTKDLWQQIEALDYRVNTGVQQKMMLQIYYLVRRATRWMLRNRKPPLDLQETIECFAPLISGLVERLPELLPENDRTIMEQEIQDLLAQGVPEVLSKRITTCNILFTSLDIVEAALRHDFDVSDMARVYYALGMRLDLNWLRDQMNAYQTETVWDELGRSSFRDDLDRAQRKLGVSVLLIKDEAGKEENKEMAIAARLEAWLAHHHSMITRWSDMLNELRATQGNEFVSYSVVLRELSDFAQTV